MDVETAEITEHNCRWRKTKGNVVGQGIKFFANGGGYMKQTRHHPVEEVEDRTNHDEEQCQIKVALECEIGGNATRDEVAAGNRVWDMFLHIRQVWL